MNNNRLRILKQALTLLNEKIKAVNADDTITHAQWREQYATLKSKLAKVQAEIDMLESADV